MLHRVIYGSIERFIRILIEHYAGAFPLWLAPVEINIIPVNNEHHLDYAKELQAKLDSAHIRVKVDDRDEKLGYKMRESQTKKIPLTIIIGDKEIENNTISYRKYGKTETTTVSVDEFIRLVSECTKNKEHNI